MRYLYSGASKDGAVQQDPELSLGGFISASPIPNDLLQNIFSEASYLSIQQKKRETKLIVLHNDSLTQSATLLSLDFDMNNDTLAKYKIAFVTPDEGGCFEEIANAAALPFNATFDDIESGVPVSLPNIEADEYLGMWITREYDFDSDDLKSKDCAYWKVQLETPTTPGTKDTLDLILDYTLV